MDHRMFELIPAAVSRNNFTDPSIKHRHHVRVYRMSPDRVQLQIRTARGYTTASLPPGVAKNIAKALINFAEECK